MTSHKTIYALSAIACFVGCTGYGTPDPSFHPLPDIPGDAGDADPSAHLSNTCPPCPALPANMCSCAVGTVGTGGGQTHSSFIIPFDVDKAHSPVDLDLGAWLNTYADTGGDYACALQELTFGTVTGSVSWGVQIKDNNDWHAIGSVTNTGDSLHEVVLCQPGIAVQTVGFLGQAGPNNWGVLNDYIDTANSPGPQQTLAATGFNDANSWSELAAGAGVITPNSTGIGITTSTQTANGSSYQAPTLIAVPAIADTVTAAGFVVGPRTTTPPCLTGCSSVRVATGPQTAGPLFGGPTSVLLASHTDTKNTLCAPRTFWGPMHSGDGFKIVTDNTAHTATLVQEGAATTQADCYQQ